LTYIENQLFIDIRPTDCVAFLKRSGFTAIGALRQKNYQVAAWVQSQVLEIRLSDKRAKKVEYFVSTAYQCLERGNFSSMRAIVLALHSKVVSRLKKTKLQVPNKVAQQLQEMANLIDDSYSYLNYHIALKARPKPVVPIIHVELRSIKRAFQDQSAIIEGKSGKLINFQRYTKLHESILDVLHYQDPSYRLEPPAEQVGWVQAQLRSMVLDEKLDKQLEDISLRYKGEEESFDDGFRQLNFVTDEDD